MKRVLCVALIAGLCASCAKGGHEETLWEKSTPGEKWRILRDYYLAPGAEASDERPLPNVLSEREALVKAADAAIAEGVLYSSYYAYQNNPALMTAHLGTPVLVTNAESGVPDCYKLTAVNDKGGVLAEVAVSSNADAHEEEFVMGCGFSSGGLHYLTKREAAELIQSQFPDQAVSEPMAIRNLRLGDDPYIHMFLFWYFTVDEAAQSAEGDAQAPDSQNKVLRDVAGGGCEGYVIGADAPAFLTGGILSNKAAIDFPNGDRHLDGYRMAKLSRPLGLFNKREADKAAGGVRFNVFPPRNTEPLDFTPVPLR